MGSAQVNRRKFLGSIAAAVLAARMGWIGGMPEGLTVDLISAARERAKICGVKPYKAGDGNYYYITIHH